MAKGDFLKEVEQAMMLHKLAKRTRKSYLEWIEKFIRFHPFFESNSTMPKHSIHRILTKDTGRFGFHTAYTTNKTQKPGSVSMSFQRKICRETLNPVSYDDIISENRRCIIRLCGRENGYLRTGLTQNA